MRKSIDEILILFIIDLIDLKEKILTNATKPLIAQAKSELLKVVMGVKPRKRPYEGGRNRRAKLFNSALAEWEAAIRKLYSEA